MEKLTLPDLPYDFSALEPVISGEIMELHYKKHHAAYVNNGNAALEQLADAEAKGDLVRLISLQKSIRFNGGGHLNHSIFWSHLSPPSKGGGAAPHGALGSALETAFGSFELFVQEMSAKSVAIQGSGWGWLGLDPKRRSLEIKTTANQDPLASEGLIPLLGIDVWEHAYYLQYKNARADYVKAIWGIINWKNVEGRFQKAIG